MRNHFKRLENGFARFFSAVLAGIVLCMALPARMEAQADTAWPTGCEIEADAGIVMDAATGTVLYGKNIHDTYAPASITKVLTALIVLEHCDLSDEVTFSYNAVRNVEDNSTSAGYEPGDTATVETLLYALLLKSANEAANALAEHVAGSTEAFAEMMNQKAAELGCQDSHFNNPSGLNDPDHYVSAYDMALILRAALEEPEFERIVSTTYYELPPNSKFPDGQGISPGNKMIKSNWPQYRSDVIGGKTGYTSIALNTLVNAAREGDFTVVTAVLHSNNTQYEDTSRMMDFAFQNFQSVLAAETETNVSRLGSDLTIGGYRSSAGYTPEVDGTSRIVLPNNASASDLTVDVDMNLPEGAPEDADARITYRLGDTQVGTAWLSFKKETAVQEVDPAGDAAVSAALSSENDGTESSSGFTIPAILSGSKEETTADGESVDAQQALAASSREESTAEASGIPTVQEILGRIPRRVIGIAAGVIFLILILNLLISIRRASKAREEMESEIRRRRREKRLQESGVTHEEFEKIKQRIREGAARRKEAGTAWTGWKNGTKKEEKEEKKEEIKEEKKED